MTGNVDSESRTVERATPMPASADALWTWHTRPGAFARLAPPWEPVEVLEQVGGISNGATVTLRVHAGPIPLNWTARHSDVEPGRGFTDTQIAGPFARWTHRHAMIPAADGTSTMVDTIRYAAPLGPIGDLMGACIFDSKLNRLLRYRHALLADDLAAHARAASAGMSQWRVAVTGSSGLVGSSLVPFLTSGGHSVLEVGRRAKGADATRWNPSRGEIDAAAFDGLDAVVHLAGENVAGGRWTPERKKAIRESRIHGTTLIARTLAAAARPPKVLVCASAVGIYGNRSDEPLDESAAHGEGFLAEVGEAWEQAADAARAVGIRVVHLRFGVVLSPAGGALAKMLPAFRLGLGGPLGGGKQWMPWLTVDDAVGMIHHAMFDTTLVGPVNAVAPEQVQNAAFGAALGDALHRPAILPVPAAALTLLFGEMAEATILGSQRVVPAALMASGYAFRHPTLASGLAHVLGTDP